MSTPPIPYAEAAALVRAVSTQLLAAGCETVALREARGRVLAEPVLADRDQPPFPRATRDGFAARAEGWVRGSLRVAGLLRAGEAWQGGASEPGSCIEIMTGAPVPAGADSVAMVEHVNREDDRVSLQAGRTLAAGDNVVPQGAESRAGAALLPSGTRLTAYGIAAAAACGFGQVTVARKPRVAILATGDELVDVSETPLPHQIRNSNTYALAAQVEALGGEPELFPPVADEPAALRDAIRRAAEHCDLLLLSGGVSMGRYDLVEPALTELGGIFHFTGVRLQPGKPVVFGALGELPFFGLPGNPVSTLVCFALFVAPVLAALAGEQDYTPPFAGAALQGAMRNRPGLTRFLPALLSSSIQGPTVMPIAWQGSGDLASTARANCFLAVPEDAGDLEHGTRITVLLA